MDHSEPSVTPSGIVCANSIRVQWYCNGTLRVEEAGANGCFCDDPTFGVLARPPLRGDVRATKDEAGYRLKADNLVLTVEVGQRAATDAHLEWRADLREARTPDGPELLLGSISSAQPVQPAEFRLPRIDSRQRFWCFRDAPRAVPPERGALPPEPGDRDEWRIEAKARDWYLFPFADEPLRLRSAFLELTGSIPVPPRWMLGLWHSRYYPYSAEGALELADEYHGRRFPLDAFVIDTDWRIGGSRGYEVNNELFPDMRSFFRQMHERNLHVVFNDHPEPIERTPLDPELFRYRRRNLGRFLEMGLSAWWFDRNWRRIMEGPAPGLETAVWGQRIYWDITRAVRPGSRPALLSMRADHPAAHRFPIWWTGDIHSDWDSLIEAVHETVEDGEQLLPWTGQDIGGHIGFPSPEQYVRWVQWGALSPTFRLHCGPKNRFREPWRFGERVETIARRFTRVRYRLMPYLSRLAFLAWRDGTPLLRSRAFRNALSWEAASAGEASRARGEAGARAAPAGSAGAGGEERTGGAAPEAVPGASAGGAPGQWDSFFLGDDIFVAPIFGPAEAEVGTYRLVPGPFRRHVYCGAGAPDLGEGQQEPIEITESPYVRLNFTDYNRNKMAWGTDFTVVWEGSFSPPQSGWYRFTLAGNGMKGLDVGPGEEEPHIRDVFDKGHNEVTLPLEEGTSYPITVRYRNAGTPPIACRLSVRRMPRDIEIGDAEWSVDVPPGVWHDAWDGTMVEGPARLGRLTPLEQLPLYLADRAIIPLLEPAASTADQDWSKVYLCVPLSNTNGTTSRLLHEDDGVSEKYQEGECRTTPLSVSRTGTEIELRAGPAEGTCAGAPAERTLTWMLHLHPGERIVAVEGADDWHELRRPEAGSGAPALDVGPDAPAPWENRRSYAVRTVQNSPGQARTAMVTVE